MVAHLKGGVIDLFFISCAWHIGGAEHLENYGWAKEGWDLAPPRSSNVPCQGGLPSSPHGTGIRLCDQKTRLMMLSAAKAGATLATQMMFRQLGLVERANAYDPIWIHNYREDVYEKEAEHWPRPAEVCGFSTKDWLCVKIVRLPIDRIVSSYIHILKNMNQICQVPGGINNFVRGELSQSTKNYDAKGCPDASFREFIDAVSLYGKQDKFVDPNDVHWMPQYEKEFDSPSSKLYYIPLELIDSTVDALADATATGLRFNVSGLTSAHYISKVDSLGFDSSATPFSKLAATTSRSGGGYGSVFPQYSTFLEEKYVAEKVCSLYCDDIQLYRRACNQRWLVANEASFLECNAQLRYLNTVCPVPPPTNRHR
mmetsp:Transcript_69861/g.157902  ORF Transcript_69861/g.157902 Transcript_69861/m.157902 type:complete len:370 (+) Transcript_69861:80-1189(+)|eukprot:CAMPEP_0172599728 /NCGR_PEP_ID=MMETSP1068-20121228/19842_1 /TAXON_ID=35684 /ORGANISM="Pseudopedinella elastica, Strain CCMP716" /LENGTH=369 /DNA_ID=CAMNT_0013400083 /DNA_START=73 /DNA_END=1182 /DNA_ORIENTATION=-